MRKFMANMAYAKEILWEIVELGFVSILAIMLIYLILGQLAPSPPTSSPSVP